MATNSSSFISPTVAWRFADHPGWTKVSNLRQEYGFGTSKNRDIKGYDLEGFNEKGIDRAGFSELEYAGDPAIASIVAPLGRQICRGFQSLVPLKTGLEVTDRVLEVLIEAFPEADVLRFSGADTFHLDEGESRIVRGHSASGELYAGLYTLLNGTQRHIYFQCDQMSAMYREIGSAYGMSCNISDLHDVEDWGREKRFTAIADLSEVEAVVREQIAEFSPYGIRFAVCIVDASDGPRIELSVVEDDNEDQTHPGDRIGSAIGQDAEEALMVFISSGNIRTRALTDMAERGLQAIRNNGSAGYTR